MILIGENIPVSDVTDLDLLRALILLEMTELSDLKASLSSFARSQGMEVNE